MRTKADILWLIVNCPSLCSKALYKHSVFLKHKPDSVMNAVNHRSNDNISRQHQKILLVYLLSIKRQSTAITESAADHNQCFHRAGAPNQFSELPLYRLMPNRAVPQKLLYTRPRAASTLTLKPDVYSQIFMV